MAEEYQNVNYVKYTKHIFILEVGWGETQFFGTGAYRTCRISGVRLSSLALQLIVPATAVRLSAVYCSNRCSSGATLIALAL